MAVKLRLRRMGKKRQPIYKIVAADSRSPRDGKFLESIGVYNPLTNPHTVEIKEDRVMYWLNVGAQPTDTVKSLFKQKGILLKRELIKRGKSEDQVIDEMDNWSKMREAKLKNLGQKKRSEKQTKEVSESTSEVKGASSEEKT